ncbi:MAG: helix-turn-helix domain-containing protein [Frankiaceae bacterium]
MPDNHPLLNYPEAAKHLRISTQGVRRLVDRGELAAVRVGDRSVRFSVDALDAYVST